MNAHRDKRGSLALVLVLFLGLVLIFTYVALNFTQTTTHHKQAQTAVDAAALAVAEEIAKVCIDSNMGRVGVVDAYQNNTVSKQPVLGINTLMARTRLDRLIARKLGNNSMMYLSNKDVDELAKITKQLDAELCKFNSDSSYSYLNKNGEKAAANLKKIATNAYNSSGLRVASVAPISEKDVTIELGNLTGANAEIITNTPTPLPEGDADVDGSISRSYKDASGKDRRYYIANVERPSAGSSKNFIFSMVGEAPSIVDRGSFKVGPAEGEGPVAVSTVVRVTVKEKIKSVVEPDKITAIKSQEACAMPGGRIITPTAGIFRLEFPQGIPKDNGQISFNTVLDIMNASQLPESADESSESSGAKGKWNGKGMYFTVDGGPFPGPGVIKQAKIGSYDGKQGRSMDDPSVALAFYVYDWIRNDCLRPNIKVVDDLLRNFKLRDAKPEETHYKTAQGDFLIQEAYATCDASTGCNVYGGIFSMKLPPDSTVAMSPGPVPDHDPRSLVDFPPGAEGAGAKLRNDYTDQAMVFRMQATVPQQLAYAPPDTMAHGFDKDGNVSTVDCNPISELLDYRDDLGNQLTVAAKSAKNAYDAGVKASAKIREIQEKIRQWEVRMKERCTDPWDKIISRYIESCNKRGKAPDQSTIDSYTNSKTRCENDIKERYLQPLAKDLETQKAIQSRATKVYLSAVSAVSSAGKAVGNMKTMTALGVDKVSTGRYNIANNNGFFPPLNEATQADIEGTSPTISTGQASGAPGDSNWLGNPAFFVQDPALNASAPCLASVLPSSQSRNFKFLSEGSATEGTGGGYLVGMSPNLPSGWARFPGKDSLPGGDFSQVTGISALLEGQSQYQALNVYSEPPGNDPRFYAVWSVMAQDNVRSSSRTDARSVNTPGNKPDCSSRASLLQVTDEKQKPCDAEAVRFQITSPLLVTPPIKEIQLPPKPPEDNVVIPDYPLGALIPPPPPPPRHTH